MANTDILNWSGVQTLWNKIKATFVAKSSVVSEMGDDETKVMSQKSVTAALDGQADRITELEEQHEVFDAYINGSSLSFVGSVADILAKLAAGKSNIVIRVYDSRAALDAKGGHTLYRYAAKNASGAVFELAQAKDAGRADETTIGAITIASANDVRWSVVAAERLSRKETGDSISDNAEKYPSSHTALMELNKKTELAGIYELFTAGYALNLLGKGLGEPQAFMSRKTGGGNITDGAAVIKEVDGVQPIVWNMIAPIISARSYDMAGITWQHDGNGNVVGNGTSTAVSFSDAGGVIPVNLFASHKYLFGAIGNLTSTIILQAFTANGNRTLVVGIGNAPVDGAYYLRMRISAGVTLNNASYRIYLYDLTQMFGAGNEPSTYEEYLSRISHYHIEDAYAYNEGELVNYRGTGIKTTGRQLWDEVWEKGAIGADGEPVASNRVRSKNFTPCIGGQGYYINKSGVVMAEYDSSKSFIKTSTIGGNFVPSSNAAYLKFHMPSPYGVEYLNDICINLSDASFNGQYEPYKSYVRDWSAVMRKFFPDGMTSLNGVKDFFNERKAVRKWGYKVFDGTEVWRKDKEHNFYYDISGIKSCNPFVRQSVMNRYKWDNYTLVNTNETNGTYNINGYRLFVCDHNYANADSWKSHLANLYAAGTPLVIYYELAEPVEDIFDKPLNLTYTVIDGGAETSLSEENSTQFEGSIAYNKDYVGVVDELALQNRVTEINIENWES